VNSDSPNVLEICDVALPSGYGLPLSLAFAPGRLHLLVSEPAGECHALLRVLGLLDLPECGEILVEGRETRGLDEEALAGLRAQRFGFVFRAPFLLTSFSVIENVAMPLFKVSQVGPEEARRRTERLLAFTGMSEAAEAAIDDLTLSAQFHVALARGLINEPSVLLVEEIDGTLTGEELDVFAMLLRRVPAEFGTTVIATASPAFARKKEDRVIELVRGSVVRDSALLAEPEP
jgi:predicted ABC-type transport system involved in lysophospholipase L1 biosynthesis ATPase subunit